jgi:hypothetical protein
MAAGRKTGGGSRKGRPNRATAAKAAAIAASGVTPLDYMLSVMRDLNVEPGRRDDMAKAAAPFVHPRLAAVAHSGPDGGPIEMSVEDRQRSFEQRQREARAAIDAAFAEPAQDAPGDPGVLH